MTYADLMQPGQVVLHPALVGGDLEQRPARAGDDAVLIAHGDLGPDAVGDVGGPPPELEDVDILAYALDQRLQIGQRQALVEHVGQPRPAGLAGPVGHIEEVPEGSHRPSRVPAREAARPRPHPMSCLPQIYAGEPQTPAAPPRDDAASLRVNRRQTGGRNLRQRHIPG